MRTHIPNVLCSAHSSLALYIVFKGNGTRSVSFTRLWYFREPTSPANEHLRQFERNLLETLFCFAFRSLSQPILAHLFGPLAESLPDTVGLNVLSPLFQGGFVHGREIGQAISCLSQSPDPEIQEYVSFRRYKKQRLTTHNLSLHRRRPIPLAEMEAALRTADPTFGQEWLNSVSLASSGSTAATTLEAQASFETFVQHLRAQYAAVDNDVRAIHPSGCLFARVGFVLDPINEVMFTTARSSEIVQHGLRIPFGIREASLEERHTLIWTHDFQQYPFPDGRILEPTEVTLGIRRKSPALHRALIMRSQLKVLFLWGPVAGASILDAMDCRGSRFDIQIRDSSYKAYASRSGAGPLLILQLPTAPWGLWNLHTGEAAKMGNIIKFALVLTKHPAVGSPYSFEGGLIVTSFLRHRYEEQANIRAGSDALQPEDLSMGERLWLTRKGLPRIEDIRALQDAAGGSLPTALITLLIVLPKRAQMPQGRDRQRHRRAHARLPDGVMDGVRRVYHQLAGNPALLAASVPDEVSEPLEHCIDNTQLRRPSEELEVLHEAGLEEDEISVLKEESMGQLEEDAGDQNLADISELAADDSPHESAQSSLRWLSHWRDEKQKGSSQVSKRSNTSVTRQRGKPAQAGQVTAIRTLDWAKERDPVFRHKAYEVALPPNRHQGHLTFAYLDLRLDRFCTKFGDGRLHIFIDAQDGGQRHLKAFAQRCEDQDPGRCIGLHITNHPENPAHIDFWPQSDGLDAVYRSNTLADVILEGASREAIIQRDRRHVGSWRGVKRGREESHHSETGELEGQDT